MAQVVLISIQPCYRDNARNYKVFNMSDILTKQISKPEFMGHCKHIFWQPDFHLLHHNRLDEASDEPGAT